MPAMPLATPTYPAQLVFIGTAIRGERAPKFLKHRFHFTVAPFDSKSAWRIPYDELPPLLSGVSSPRWSKWKEPSPGDGASVAILPSARFLTSGEEVRNAPWARWSSDVVVICVFLEEKVTTEKRLQQSLPSIVDLPRHTQLVVVGFRLQPLESAEMGLTDCDMDWDQANELLSKTHPSIAYFAQVPTTLDQAGDNLYQLFAWLVARRIKRLPLDNSA